MSPWFTALIFVLGAEYDFNFHMFLFRWMWIAHRSYPPPPPQLLSRKPFVYSTAVASSSPNYFAPSPCCHPIDSFLSFAQFASVIIKLHDPLNHCPNGVRAHIPYNINIYINTYICTRADGHRQIIHRDYTPHYHNRLLVHLRGRREWSMEIGLPSPQLRSKWDV